MWQCYEEKEWEKLGFFSPKLNDDYLFTEIVTSGGEFLKLSKNF